MQPIYWRIYHARDNKRVPRSVQQIPKRGTVQVCWSMSHHRWSHRILQSLRDKIGYVVFPMGPQTIKILNLPENHERFAKNLAKAQKPLPTYAQQFEAARRAQMKTTVGPVERARIMAEHMAAGTYSEGVEDGSD